MKKIAALTALLALFLVFLPSCIKKGDPLAYEKGKINAEIVISMNGTSLRAKMELMPITEGKKRDADLVFLSPESVAGLSVSRKSGETRATLGDFEPSGLDCDALLFATELFSTEGKASTAEPDELNGERVTRLSVVNEESSYTVWLTRDGLPKRIASENMTVDVIWMETE